MTTTERAARILEIKIDMARKSLRSLPKAEREATINAVTRMCDELAGLYKAQRSAERVVAHRASMKRLGEILAARKAARRPEAK